jgi:hypothetical protein
MMSRCPVAKKWQMSIPDTSHPQVHVLSRAAVVEPQGRRRAANQQPVAVEALGSLCYDASEAWVVERRHGAMLTAMGEAWKVLAAAGLPLNHSEDGSRFDDASVRKQLQAVIAQGVPACGPERDALAAWLGALCDHFPKRAARLGSDLPALVENLRAGVDPGRYVKLRRIALERLAGLI